MKTSDYEAELFAFFEQYAEFLAHVLQDEEEKLGALLSNSLPRIEHSISTAQANSKQMENYELKRVRLQEMSGYAGMTFSEILDFAPEEERQGLEALFRRIQGYVDEIQFRNGKAMNVARTNLMELDPTSQSWRGSSATTNAYVRASEKLRAHSSLLETKI